MSRDFVTTLILIAAGIVVYGGMMCWRHHEASIRPTILNLRGMDPPTTTSVHYVDYDLDGTNDTKEFMSPTNCATYIRVDGEWGWLFNGVVMNGFPTNAEGWPITSKSKRSSPQYVFRRGRWIQQENRSR